MTLTRDAADHVAAAIGSLPRVRLTQLPTPLEPLHNLSAALGAAIWAKRDDLTGLALGGNKVRELEYHLGEAVAIGADTIITTGNSQSNHARTTAAACARLGLDCRLVLEPGLKPRNGNLLLDHLFGAQAELLPGYTPASAVEAMEALAADLRHAGRTPHIIPFGGCSTTGAIGFVGGALELCRQIDDQELEPDAVYLATASCGTQAGLLAGIAAAAKNVRVRGISVSDPPCDPGATGPRACLPDARPAWPGPHCRRRRCRRRRRLYRRWVRPPDRRLAGGRAASRHDRRNPARPRIHGQGDGWLDRPRANRPHPPGLHRRVHAYRWHTRVVRLRLRSTHVGARLRVIFQSDPMERAIRREAPSPPSPIRCSPSR